MSDDDKVALYCCKCDAFLGIFPRKWRQLEHSIFYIPMGEPTELQVKPARRSMTIARLDGIMFSNVAMLVCPTQGCESESAGRFINPPDSIDIHDGGFVLMFTTVKVRTLDALSEARVVITDIIKTPESELPSLSGSGPLPEIPIDDLGDDLLEAAADAGHGNLEDDDFPFPELDENDDAFRDQYDPEPLHDDPSDGFQDADVDPGLDADDDDDGEGPEDPDAVDPDADIDFQTDHPMDICPAQEDTSRLKGEIEDVRKRGNQMLEAIMRFIEEYRQRSQNTDLSFDAVKIGLDNAYRDVHELQTNRVFPQDMQALKDELASLGRDLMVARSHSEDLSQLLGQTQSEMQNIKAGAFALKDDFKSVDVRLNALQSMYSDQVTDLRSQVSKVIADHKRFETKMVSSSSPNATSNSSRGGGPANDDYGDLKSKLDRVIEKTRKLETKMMSTSSSSLGPSSSSSSDIKSRSTAEMDDLRSRLAQAIDASKQLDAQVADMEPKVAEVDDLRSLLDDALEGNKRLETRVDNLRPHAREISDIRSQLAKTTESNSVLENKVDNLRPHAREILDLRAQLAKALEGNSALESKMMTHLQPHAGEIADLRAQMAEVLESNRQLSAKVSDTPPPTPAASHDTIDLRAQLAHVLESNARLEGKVADLQSLHSNEVASLHAKLSEATEANKQLQSQMATIQSAQVREGQDEESRLAQILECNKMIVADQALHTSEVTDLRTQITHLAEFYRRVEIRLMETNRRIDAKYDILETMHSSEVSELRSLVTKAVETNQQVGTKSNSAQVQHAIEMADLRSQLAHMIESNRRLEAHQESMQSQYTSEVSELRAQLSQMIQSKETAAASSVDADAAAHHDGAMALATICHEVAHATTAPAAVDPLHEGDGAAAPTSPPIGDVYDDSAPTPAVADAALSPIIDAASPPIIDAASPPIVEDVHFDHVLEKPPHVLHPDDVADLRAKIADFVADNVQIRTELAALDGRHAQEIAEFREQMAKMTESNTQLGERFEAKLEDNNTRFGERLHAKLEEHEARFNDRFDDNNTRFGERLQAKLEEHETRFNETLEAVLTAKMADSNTHFNERLEAKHALHAGDVADIRSGMVRIRSSIDVLAEKIEAQALAAKAERNIKMEQRLLNGERTPQFKTPNSAAGIVRRRRMSDDELQQPEEDILRHRRSAGATPRGNNNNSTNNNNTNTTNTPSTSRKRPREAVDDGRPDDPPQEATSTPVSARRIAVPRRVVQLASRPAETRSSLQSAIVVPSDDDQSQPPTPKPITPKVTTPKASTPKEPLPTQRETRQSKAARGRGRGGRGRSGRS